MSDWVPLMDYAMRKGVSMSTLRRHIKARKIPYRIENGKYLLLLEEGELQQSEILEERTDRVATEQMGLAHLIGRQGREFALEAFDRDPVTEDRSTDMIAALQRQNKQLSSELQKAHEEIAELKTLIALYEEKMFRQRLDV